jgi:hypothetical protein
MQQSFPYQRDIFHNFFCYNINFKYIFSTIETRMNRFYRIVVFTCPVYHYASPDGYRKLTVPTLEATERKIIKGGGVVEQMLQVKPNCSPS